MDTLAMRLPTSGTETDEGAPSAFEQPPDVSRVPLGTEGRGYQRPSERPVTPGGGLPTTLSAQGGGGTQIGSPTPSRPTSPSPFSLSPGAGVRPAVNEAFPGVGAHGGGLLGGGLGIPGLEGGGSTDVLQTLLKLLEGMPGR